ncbi:non-hydrolyzing UDP-N-acetylglucosamine 2-epimerase [Cohnella fermenti]|uniref:UDP-N-acetylglucosamine 2-epimerase (Non-hydrolyzing) n=1 Tax=Cohnella fermenti TaxID=2565925 RepID=A0A4S4BGK5_9BACL|nr:UDP-N-acetylglucosamine 2-epimerase (non-hydrolyzing) [Cohnella fermenti]THF73365.1 UDP-N-acetylglucosamine 2-epimerase (non-hydrolyzing) [Cohnella fermenti]
MRIVTILGTRPEVIRLSLLTRLLDDLASRHTTVHTGQNFDWRLNGIFYEEMGLRLPDVPLDIRETTVGRQLAGTFGAIEDVLRREKPDRVLVLGDTNSALCALVAERMGIPVAHMEAGNRCFDLSVPEEKNRRVIDAVSTINLPYTENSKNNLLREGFPVQRIVLSGNPIREVLEHYRPQIDASPILDKLGLESGRYLLATIHRAENVDNPAHLAAIVEGLRLTAERQGLRIVCSTHPRTRSKLQSLGPALAHPLVEFHEPFGFFDFVLLEKHARCVLTDSGTVQEECCLFQVPTVTVRKTTERPETVDCGSNVVSGLRAERIAGSVHAMISAQGSWTPPPGYMELGVARKVAKYVLGGTMDV